MAKNNYCTIYIVRHGQTDWNSQGIIQGQSNSLLDAEGIKQAQNLKEELKHIDFDAVFSSDLIRAKRTAEIIALERGLAIETTRLLRERSYSKFEGKSYRYTRKFHDIWENLSKKERITYRPYKGYETDGEITSRFITFIREIAVRYPGKTVLVVSHGGIMRAFLHHLSENTYLQGAITNTAYIKLESDGVDFFIKELKGVKHPN